MTDIELDKNTILIRRLGANKTETLGSFRKNALVDGEEVCLRFHVIPSNATSFKAILGNDILSQVDVNFNNSRTTVIKKDRDNFMMQMILDESKEFEEIDVKHVKDPQQRKEIKDIFDNYRPRPRPRTLK